MAISLIQAPSVEELFLKLTAFDAENSEYWISNIIHHEGKFSCMTSTNAAPVTVKGIDGATLDGAMHVWVVGGSDCPSLPVRIES